MIIISVFNNRIRAGDALIQLSKMPIADDVSFIARESTELLSIMSDTTKVIDSPCDDEELVPAIDSYIPIISMDNLDTGKIVIGGKLVDFINTTDIRQNNLYSKLGQIGFDSGTSILIAKDIKRDCIVVLSSIHSQNMIDMIRELKNFGDIDTQVVQNNYLMPE